MQPENVGKQFAHQTGHQPVPSGAPLHDLTGGGEYYPDDVYSSRGRHIYATKDATSQRDYATAMHYKGQPDKPVQIFRAVPKHVESIQPGDWVAIGRDYAKQHGESNLGGDYKILSMNVPAKHVRTPADSISEWGYFPHD